MSLNALNRFKSQPRWKEIAKSIREFLYVIAKGDSPEAISKINGRITSSAKSSSSQ
jgi:hypothetical protein